MVGNGGGEAGEEEASLPNSSKTFTVCYAMATVLRRFAAPILRFLGRMRRSLIIASAIAVLGEPALERAGLLETTDERRGILDVGYLVAWWLIALLVVVAPTYKDEALFYFPAILALSVAWLVTMPSFGQFVVGTDFSVVRPPKGIWGRFLDEIQKRRVDIPSVLLTDESKAKVDAFAPDAFPIVVPVVLLRWFRWLGARAVAVALIGMGGLLIGPFLATVHWWRGWSPVSLLYAVSAPWVAVLLVSLLIPPLAHSLVAGLKADRDLEQLFKATSAKDTGS
jgi:hypothetical protein